MPGIEYNSMASRYHPHHPLNRQSGRDRRSTFSSMDSRNPYASYMAEAPPAYSSHHHHHRSPKIPSRDYHSRASGSDSEDSWWSRSPDDHPPTYPSLPREKVSREKSHRDGSRRDNSSGRRPRRLQVRPPYASQYVQPDIIDRLDDASFGAYHHEGPFDAASPQRNRVSKNSPIEAVKESIEETLRATPRDKIIDTIESHRPLDGVAYYPPGTTDREGQTYQYEEGSNMMDEYGLFMRTPGKKFTDEDFKNDPFYNQPHPNYLSNLKRKISLKRWKERRGTL
ncbi:Uncharacterized protein PECH_003050 [Penicillium ucsense]|uniref:Pal1 cell morphology n=1 Tax=Penicillium ucsense TaxID=2839758 RepID=A0A8J8VYS9_9EURO|nr:Uncharacterized protein PECM_008397 [Penicillium ucsense]KAF7730011.1 Uncharacterized protein PECH_003050 [Penicillium ucsense]